MSPWYIIQVDKSTDVDNKAMIFVFVRYIFQENVHEDMFCALLLPTNTTAASLQMTTYQENRTGHFLSVFIWMEQLPGMDGFMVSLVRSKSLLSNVSLHTMSSIEKCWLAKKCHLNLTVFCRM